MLVAVAFPFDNLKCSIQIGGWALSGAQQGIELHDGGFDFATQEATSGSSYQEYSIMHVDVRRVINEYPCCPNEPWPVVYFTVTLSRSQGFYILVIIVPTIIITCLSFVVFYAPSHTADSLGYGITVIVVVILMQVRDSLCHMPPPPVETTRPPLSASSLALAAFHLRRLWSWSCCPSAVRSCGLTSSFSSIHPSA